MINELRQYKIYILREYKKTILQEYKNYIKKEIKQQQISKYDKPKVKVLKKNFHGRYIPVA